MRLILLTVLCSCSTMVFGQATPPSGWGLPHDVYAKGDCYTGPHTAAYSTITTWCSTKITDLGVPPGPHTIDGENFYVWGGITGVYKTWAKFVILPLNKNWIDMRIVEDTKGIAWVDPTGYASNEVVLSCFEHIATVYARTKGSLMDATGNIALGVATGDTSGQGIGAISADSVCNQRTPDSDEKRVHLPDPEIIWFPTSDCSGTSLSVLSEANLALPSMFNPISFKWNSSDTDCKEADGGPAALDREVWVYWYPV